MRLLQDEDVHVRQTAAAALTQLHENLPSSCPGTRRSNPLVFLSRVTSVFGFIQRSPTLGGSKFGGGEINIFVVPPADPSRGGVKRTRLKSKYQLFGLQIVGKTSSRDHFLNFFEMLMSPMCLGPWILPSYSPLRHLSWRTKDAPQVL